MGKIRASVCIATYNGEKFIMEQIFSILKQMSTEDEIIISDDGSTDKTIKIIEQIDDPRIKLVINSNNLKRNSLLNKFYRVTKNFENALIYARGEYIFFVDQDDVWSDDKVNVSLRYLQDYDLVVSNYYLIDGNSDLLENSVRRLINKGFVGNFIANPYIGCLMAFRKDILTVSLPFPNKLIAHDIWVGFISQMVGKVIFIDEKLIYHRRHGKNLSYTSEKSQNKLFIKLYYRMIFLKLIITRFFKIKIQRWILRK